VRSSRTDEYGRSQVPVGAPPRFEEQLAQHLGVPEDVALVGLLPVGFPQGRFGPVTRRPAGDLAHFDRWGITKPEETQK
jgi:nitroreductase